MKIKNIWAREILDSNGWPTVEAEVVLENGIKALGQVPSGASTGKNEALELRDEEKQRFLGKGVLKAVGNINEKIRKILIGKDVENQEEIDNLMIEADGTSKKKNLGANALLAVSMAVCRAAARNQGLPLYEYFSRLLNNKKLVLPQPMILVFEGGKHGNWATNIQEFFVIPKKEVFSEFKERLRVGVEIYKRAEMILKERGWPVGVGYEGAFCPQEVKDEFEVLELIRLAILEAGFKLKEEILVGLDIAASEFYEEGRYKIGKKREFLDPWQWQERIEKIFKNFPEVWSVEDVFEEESWQNWQEFTNKYGGKYQIVADDLTTTNLKRIKKVVENKAANAIIIKPNQVGTISETLRAISLAHSYNLATIISHRSGETNDELIADLAVGSGVDQVKFGAPRGGERIAKYNRLLRIETSWFKDKSQ